MQSEEHSAARPLGICRRLYNFVMAILNSRALPVSLPQQHSNNNDGEITIDFSGALQRGKKAKTGSNGNNNVNIKFKPYEARAQASSSGRVKQRHSKETSLHGGGGDHEEDAKVVIPRPLINSNVFTNVDSRAEEFIRSRLEAMRRSH